MTGRATRGLFVSCPRPLCGPHPPHGTASSGRRCGGGASVPCGPDSEGTVFRRKQGSEGVRLSTLLRNDVGSGINRLSQRGRQIPGRGICLSPALHLPSSGTLPWRGRETGRPALPPRVVMRREDLGPAQTSVCAATDEENWNHYIRDANGAIDPD